ncbi:hypothetical protein HYY71_03535, partial [Candidatus Woesearchaeota archaeon]|nr:hypothetical protein [Candidatus Woesearchaeota archaeon]
MQGKLTNSAGASQQGTFNFTFKIYDNTTAGNELWASVNQSITTDVKGIYDVILTGIDISFADEHYLGIAVGTDNESVPYSFRANISEALNPNASYVVTNLSVTGNATIGAGGTTLEISAQTFNLTKSGSASLAGNITLGDQIKFGLGQVIDNLVSGFLRITGNLNVTGNVSIAQNTLFVDNTTGRVGIGITSPNDVLEVIGNVRISGSLNATNINASRFYARNGSVSAPAYTFIEDTNTGIIKTSEDNLTFVTGGSSRVTIDSSGNVGIGTSSPAMPLHVIGNANISSDLFVLGSIYGTIGAGNISGTLLDSQIDNDLTIQTTKDLAVGGGYSAGGITLVASGGDKGSGQFAKDILVDGQIVAINDVEINESFIPTRDNFSMLGNHTNRFVDTYTSNIKSGNTTLTLNANVSITGNLTIDTDTLVVDDITNRVGIGTTTPNDILEIVGNVRISGSLNASSINATNINVTSLILGWTNLTSYPSACSAGQFVTQVGDALTCDTPAPASGGGWTDDGSVVRLTTATDLVGIGTTTPDNLLTILGNELTANAILHLNASDSFNTTVVNVMTLD